jgi:hypothetical protein
MGHDHFGAVDDRGPHSAKQRIFAIDELAEQFGGQHLGDGAGKRHVERVDQFQRRQSQRGVCR